jgi:hypothetical protein
VPTTTEEKIAGINKNPCTPGQVNQTITNITNVLNEVNGNGTVMARCTLTSDGLTCAPGTLEVSSFTPLVKDFAALGIATPTEAVQYLNIATFGAAVGYIVYNWDDEQWEVLEIIRTLRNNLVDPPSLTDRTLSFPYETQSVNECDATGVRDVVFSTVTIAVVTELEKTVNGIEWNDVEVEVWATGSSTPGLIPTVIRSGLRDLYKEDCTVYMQEREFEVFSSTDDPAEYEAWIYTDELVALVDVFLAEDLNIWGYFQTVKVPCLGELTQALLIETTQCGSGSGSGSG